MNRKIKVLYVVGPTRSGSTIFSNILNETDGFFNAGELIEYWDRGLKWPCSCGADTYLCHVWENIIREMNLSDAEYSQIGAFVKSKSHSSRVLKDLLFDSRNGKKHDRSEMLDAIGRLYGAIQEATGCRVIVDASKNPAYAFLLGAVSDIDLYLVHLVRDSRAVAYSWQKKKQNLWTANVVETSLVWLLRNSVAEMIGNRNSSRYLRLYYEDFIIKPRERLEEVFQFVGAPDTLPPIQDDGVIKMGANHGLCGNPVRFDSGPTRLELDSRFVRMKPLDRMIVTTLTMPGLLKYGYPIRIVRKISS